MPARDGLASAGCACVAPGCRLCHGRLQVSRQAVTATPTYTSEGLIAAYRALGLKPGDTVSLKTGLRSLGRFRGAREQVLDIHLNALDQVIDLDRGTVVVATSTTNLCNTTIPFSLKDTPGIAGALTEHVRTMPGAERSYHAFESYAALGARAAEMLGGLGRHAYGPDTPEARLVEADAKCVSLGLRSEVTCSIVHHMEMVAGVPYRYVREYHHPVVREGGRIRDDVFFRHPWYRTANVKKSYASFFRQLRELGFEERRVSVGASGIEAYSMRHFCHLAKRLLNKNIYAVLAFEPTRRPWQD